MFVLGCNVGVATGCVGDLGTGPSPTDNGAGDGSSGNPAPAEPTVFDQAMIETARGYKNFSRIDSRAYPSTLGTFDINLYVWGDAHDYRQITPEATTTAVTPVDIPVGTVIVREVLTADGTAVEKLTLMAKGPSGYDPTLGDWWFAVLDPNFAPLPDANGALQVGKLAACHGCHVPRETDDFLFGVPKIYQARH